LRPLGVGEVLDGAFTTIRRYPAATLGLAAAVMLVVEVIQVLANYYLLHGVAQNHVTATGTVTNGDYAARLFTADGLVLIVTFWATVLLTGMLTVVVGQAALGRPMGIRQAWEGTRPLIWRLIGATILIGLVTLGATLVAAIPGAVVLVFGVAAGSTGVVVLGVVLIAVSTLVTTIYVVNLLIFTTPALILEKLPVVAALRRSRALVRSSWWRIFGIALLAQIIAGVIGGIITIPFEIAGGYGSLLSGHPAEQYRFVPLLLTGIGGLISATLVRPFSAGVIALLYIDRRMRAEALDLTLQQAAANNSS
jgi:hypothetical protein